MYEVARIFRISKNTLVIFVLCLNDNGNDIDDNSKYEHWASTAHKFNKGIKLIV